MPFTDAPFTDAPFTDAPFTDAPFTDAPFTDAKAIRALTARMRLLRPLLSASAALTLTTACAIVPDAPNVEGTPRAEGTPVALLQPVRVGDVVVTPRSVKEDSRCPQNARCVWPGRLIVTTRIDGAGWRDTTDIALGETYGTHDQVIALVSGTPERSADRDTAPREYRFVYESR